jgi:hypothetical protein
MDDTNGVVREMPVDTVRINSLLARKREIEDLPDGQFIERQRWMLDATETLLRSVLELKEELQEHGILR